MDIRPLLPQALPQLRKALYGLLRSPDHETVDELLQTACVKALTNEDRFTEGGNIVAWLFTIAKFHHFDQRRNARRRGEVILAWDDFVLAVSIPSHEAKVIASIQLEQIAQHIQFDLHKTQRVVMLAALRGEEAREISEQYGISDRRVREAMGRARKSLAHLNDWRD